MGSAIKGYLHRLMGSAIKGYLHRLMGSAIKGYLHRLMGNAIKGYLHRLTAMCHYVINCTQLKCVYLNVKYNITYINNNVCTNRIQVINFSIICIYNIHCLRRCKLIW